MIKDHLILVGAWVLFGFLHSFIAGDWFTTICRSVMGRHFVYYRLIYSGIAILSLTGVLVWQFSMTSFSLGPFPLLKWVVGLPLGCLGLVFFGNSVRKYFFHL